MGVSAKGETSPKVKTFGEQLSQIELHAAQIKTGGGDE
jgi:hypothetical protein